MSKATSILEKLMWLWWLILTASILQVVWWHLDDKPPFTLISYTSTVAKPGGVVSFDADVKRDLSRKCSVTFSRHMFDSKGHRTDISSGQTMTSKGIAEMDNLTPNKLKLDITVPVSASPGLAHLFTVLDYRCSPIHYWAKPIEMTMELDFIVIAP